MIGIEQSEDLAPGGVLLEGERTKLIKACLTSSQRKRKAFERWLIYTEQHEQLIYERLRTTLNDEAYRD
jgi:hypothetical protein